MRARLLDPQNQKDVDGQLGLFPTQEEVEG